MDWKRISLAAVLVGMLGGATAVPATARKPRQRTEYPVYCAGVVAGMSTDRDVRRMYGDGLFVRDEGHGGGRYFTDPKRTVTLHVVIGVDSGIDEVSYSRGVRLPQASPSAVSQAVSPRLTGDESVWRGIRLGETAADVLRQFGKPKKETRSGAVRVIRYESDYNASPYVLFYEAEFRFASDRLVAVRLYNGE